MSDTPQMNDEAARSPTGEILDQATPPTPPPPKDGETPPTPSEPSKEGEAPKTPAQGAPETYAEFTLPEGLALSKETLEAATPIFKELGLSQEAAQKLVSFHADQLKAALPSVQESAYTEMRKDWAAKTLADKDISGYTLDGKTGIDAVKIDIGRALGTLDPTLKAEFQAAMDLTGAGDHPAFVKAMWRLSQAVSEGRPVTGKGPSPLGQKAPGDNQRPSPAKSLYPNLP